MIEGDDSDSDEEDDEETPKKVYRYLILFGMIFLWHL